MTHSAQAEDKEKGGRAGARLERVIACRIHQMAQRASVNLPCVLQSASVAPCMPSATPLDVMIVKTAITVRLTPELLKAVRNSAERENRTLTNFVETALKERMESSSSKPTGPSHQTDNSHKGQH